MEKPVIISIKGVQNTGCQEEDIMELVTHGAITSEKNGELALTYPETELTGMEGTMTTFRVGKDRITLHREGVFNSDLIFEEGHKHLSLYDTPYGGVILGVRTQRAHSGLSLTGGDMEIRYELEVDNEKVSENYFEIHVKEPTLAAPVL